MAGMRIQAVFDGHTLESERDHRIRACLFTGVAAGVYHRGDQASGKETRGGDHTQNGTGDAGTGTGPTFVFWWRNCAQYRLYRAHERDHARATRQLDTQVSACG